EIRCFEKCDWADKKGGGAAEHGAGIAKEAEASVGSCVCRTTWLRNGVVVWSDRPIGVGTDCSGETAGLAGLIPTAGAPVQAKNAPPAT
ncbi:MAG: hypothetical protein JWN04_96, partial [Myxococcaceae bacterium]|nr:hypothetical protein [Myxococcaceae bacterium]